MYIPLTSLLAQGTEARAITDSTLRSMEANINALTEMSSGQALEQLITWGITLGKNILIALVLFFVGRWIIRRLTKLTVAIMEKRHVDASLRSFIKNLINITLTLFLIIVIIGVLGIDTTSFIALFASAGLAIGMALSGTLQNFAGGVMVLLFKPYRVGDYIEAQGQGGAVKEIQLFNTVINTPDNKTIMIPNGGLSTGIINNYSKEQIRRVEWIFNIGYGDNYDTAETLLLDLLKEDKRVLNDPKPFVALYSLGDSSVNIVTRAWVESADFWNVYFDLNEMVYKVFTKNNLNIPFPQMDVYLHQRDKVLKPMDYGDSRL